MGDGGWEYAPLFNLRFHAHERKMDLVRRRRWHRKMVPDAEALVPGQLQFALSEEGGEAKEGVGMASPRMYLQYKQQHKYQLRAYVYQARHLLAGDKTGFSDPYAAVSFLTQSRQTESISETLSPTWDQTLILDDVLIVGPPEALAANPPFVIVELFDHDAYGSPEFLGRAMVRPRVQLRPNQAVSPRLEWHGIQKGARDGGELLASFELFLKDGASELPFLPPKKGELFIVPSGIRPIVQRTAVE
ncbi:unnamed protein product, partial [Darwinula stevensoni]